jgi:hypothetical protein
MLAVHPYNVLLASYVARSFPSWCAPITTSRVCGLPGGLPLSSQAMSLWFATIANSHMTDRKVALVDRVIKGKDHFYSSWLASAAIGPVRAFVLRWWCVRYGTQLICVSCASLCAAAT